MILHNRFKEKAMNAAMIFFFLLAAGLYSCTAQILPPKSAQELYDKSNGDVKNAGSKIRLLTGVNVNANAIALGEFINGPFAELKPILTPLGDRLYFSRSLHPLNTGGELDLEDIWYSEYSQEDNAWSEPIHLPGHLNNAGPNFVNSISMTGDTLILGNRYTKKGKMRSGLSYSIISGGQWSRPVPIHIENDYNLSNHANSYVSLKSGIIVSAIQRCDSKGDRDLYVSFWNGERATEPINMGGVINSNLEESSPFLSSDNETLYFASKGHLGYGGYDIYVTKRLDDSWTNWTVPQNLGPAVNGIMDDEFFSITHCGTYAVFTKQVNVHNWDLYKISLNDLLSNYCPQEDKGIQKETTSGVLAKL